MQMTLKALRHNAGLLQTDVALALDVSRKTVGAWESGKSMPNPHKIDAICALFGVSYDNIKWRT